jgi:hypothetical protein
MEEFKNKPAKLDVSEQINDAFEIYKKVALTGGLAMLSLYFIISILFFVGMGFFFKPEEFPIIIKNFNPDKLSLNGQLIYLAAITVFSALISPFTAGIIKMAYDADNDQEVQFSSIFTYVNNPQFIHILLSTIVLTVTSTGLNMVLKHFLIDSLAAFLGILISLSIVIVTYLAIPLIIFRNLNFSDAIKTSTIQILNNFFPAILLMFIAFVLAIVGIFGFCIGILFTMPFIYVMHYCIYKKLNT